eukprot:Cvel_21296.t1-p1 / transcript=Cvel_21296.t1 / gene=Cvel_21296 / organism=Chromera_velia_CCMP2878 / gene_product=hypothetical protein / transcript_product=hypothetical protein / location=Cvel_scaffold1984:194-5370(-) / protein_length=271 / sequence_SO=supercontig / SO=protein_coding / is_pseudo=false
MLEETTFEHLGVAMNSSLTEERNKRVNLFASLSNGDTLLADVFVTFPIFSNASRLRTRSKTVGAAAKTKSEEKVWKYAVAARVVGLTIWFVLLVFETFERPDREIVSFVKELVSNNVWAGVMAATRDWDRNFRTRRSAVSLCEEGSHLRRVGTPALPQLSGTSGELMAVLKVAAPGAGCSGVRGGGGEESSLQGLHGAACRRASGKDNWSARECGSLSNKNMTPRQVLGSIWVGVMAVTRTWHRSSRTSTSATVCEEASQLRKGSDTGVAA